MTEQVNPFVQAQSKPETVESVSKPESSPKTESLEPVAPVAATPVQPSEVKEPDGTVITNPGGTDQAITSPSGPTVTPTQPEPVSQTPAADPTVVGTVTPATQASPPQLRENPAPPMITQPEGVMNLTFDDDIKINTLDKLPKLKKEETSRIGFILFDSNNSPLIKMSYYFYDDVSRKLFLAPKNKDTLAMVVNKIGEPKIRFGTPVIRYQTDQYGNLPAQWSYSIHAFIFSTDKFPILKALHKEWGLQAHDILMTCTEAEYQKVAMNVARESLWRTLPAKYLNDIHQKATEAYEKHINRMMGRPMPDNDILALLGMAGPQTGPGTSGVVNPFPTKAEAPLTQMAGQVGTGSPQTAEFSHLVTDPNKQAQ